MWIESVEIAGFGRLSGTFEFSPEITLVTGPNESGKSTLHTALLRALFGFTSSDRRRYSGESELTTWSPWGGPPFGLAAVVRNAERSLRVTWTFDRDQSSQVARLIDDATGEDLTAQVLQKHGNTTTGAYLLGIDYDEFCQVCMVEQAAIGAVESSDALVNSLRKAVEMGASDVGVDGAIDLLDRSLRDVIGVRRDTISPLRGGPLGRGQERLDEIDRALAIAENTQAELRTLAEQLEAARREEHEAADRLVATEQELLLARAHELDQRTASAEAAQAQAQDKPEIPLGIDQEEVSRLGLLLGELDRLSMQQRELGPAAGASRSRVGEVEAEILQVQARMRAVEAYRDVDRAEEHNVRDGVARVEELVREPGRQPEARIARPAATPLWAAAGVVVVLSLIATVLAGPAALAGLLVAAGLAWLAIRAGGRVGVPVDAEALSRRRAALDAELGSALDRAHASPAQDSLIRARSYLDACERRSEHDAYARQLAELRVQANDAGEASRDADRIAGEARRAEADFKSGAAALPIGEGDPVDLAEARLRFADASRRLAEAQQRRDHAAGAGSGLKAALGDLTVDQLVEQRDDAAAELREHVARNGELVTEPRDEARVQSRLAALNDERERGANEIGRLTALVEEREQSLTPVPGLREEREQRVSYVERLATGADALVLARESLRSAASEAHRRFAPVLNKAVETHLPRITGGRYGRARVSEDLELTLDAPETGEQVSVDVLSRGTQDQIYLVQRLAILEMLASGLEPAPLLLDDVFVHFDDQRLGFALEMLAEQAKDRQVIMFADDARIEEGLAALGGDHRTITLTGPTTAAPA